MPMTIWLQDATYKNLSEIRVKDETYSQAVDRLIDLHRMLRGLEPILRGQKAYQEFLEKRERDKEVKVDGEDHSLGSL